MNNAHHRCLRLIRVLAAAVCLCGGGFGAVVCGQALDMPGGEGVVTNTPSLAPLFSTTPVALPPRLASTSQLAGPPPAGSASAEPLLAWGPIDFRPHLFYSLSYGNGLQATPGHQSNTLINEIDPGMLFRLGDHWTLNYTPTLRFYSSKLFQDTWDNSVLLAGQTESRNWTVGFSQSYVSSSQPTVETASQLDQETYSTTLNATYRMSTALSLELAGNQSFQFVGQGASGEQLSDWRTWSTMDWLNYQFGPNLGAALGAGFDYDNLSVGADMTSEQVQGRITWRAGKKLSLMASGGMQDRQFLGTGVADFVAPIFSLSAQYQVFEQTLLTLTASRTVSPAFFQNQITESSLVSVGLQQRLLGRLHLAVTTTYGTTSYQTTTAGPVSSIASNFDTTSLNVTLSTTFLRRATASVFYQLSYFTSASAIYDYSTTQIGVAMGYGF